MVGVLGPQLHETRPRRRGILFRQPLQAQQLAREADAGLVRRSLALRVAVRGNQLRVRRERQREDEREREAHEPPTGRAAHGVASPCPRSSSER